jgi:plastocyanin
MYLQNMSTGEVKMYRRKSAMKAISNNIYQKQQIGTIGLALVAGLMAMLVLILSACQSAVPTPTTAPANIPVATDMPAPSNTPAATEASPPTNTPAPTDAPVLTDTPIPPPTEAAATPSVTVADQPLLDGKVTIEKVISNGPGWLVVHADKDGAPGPVLGHTAVDDGENTHVVVELTAEGRTQTLYAMLHMDAGTVGTYEFPGPDGPVSVNGAVVTPAFHITGGLEETPAMSEQAAVKLVNSEFTPKELTVKVGTTVVWTSEDNPTHTITADDGSFDSGRIRKGDTFSHTFTQAGEYPYYCAIHGAPGGVGMSGIVVVTN